MARVKHVKKAQQRYETKPVLNEDGTQKTIAILRKDGTPKTAKGGRPIVRRLTENDLTRPKPNRKCDKCGVEIEVGMPYKYLKIKTSTYGSRTLVRCQPCPVWHEWEYRDTRSAQASRIVHETEGAIAEAGSIEDITAILEGAADEIRELAEQAREGADNIVDGFGHETSQSDELNEQADSIEAWADEVAEWEADAEPEPVPCDVCDGTGQVDNPDFDPDDEDCTEDEETECEACEGTGEIEGDELSDEQLDEIRDSATEPLNNCPI